MAKRFIYAGLFAVVCLGLVVLFLVKKLDHDEAVQVQGAIPEDAILFAEDMLSPGAPLDRSSITRLPSFKSL